MDFLFLSGFFCNETTFVSVWLTWFWTGAIASRTCFLVAHPTLPKERALKAPTYTSVLRSVMRQSPLRGNIARTRPTGIFMIALTLTRQPESDTVVKLAFHRLFDV